MSVNKVINNGLKFHRLYLYVKMKYRKLPRLVKDSYTSIWNPTKHEIDAKLFRTYTVRNLLHFCSQTWKTQGI